MEYQAGVILQKDFEKPGTFQSGNVLLGSRAVLSQKSSAVVELVLVSVADDIQKSTQELA